MTQMQKVTSWIGIGLFLILIIAGASVLFGIAIVANVILFAALLWILILMWNHEERWEDNES